ncbi:MAG: hypothetical protein ABL903_08475 [Methylococcales bacterium]
MATQRTNFDKQHGRCLMAGKVVLGRYGECGGRWNIESIWGGLRFITVHLYALSPEPVEGLVVVHGSTSSPRTVI